MCPGETPNAPPTTPGRLGIRTSLPLSRPAIWALICGGVGLILTPLALAGIVVGIVALVRLSKQKGERQGHGLAIAGIVTGGVGLVMGVFYGFMIWSGMMAFEQATVAAGASRLNLVHGQAVAYARQNAGYPEHVALLAENQSLPIERIVANSRRTRPDEVTIGDYDFADYDGSFEADQAVLAAVERIDKSAPTYRFGDTNFVRLAAPTGDPDIVFCWRTLSEGVVVAVMDDGSTNTAVGAEEWAALCEDDAAARGRLGLPAIELPADP